MRPSLASHHYINCNELYANNTNHFKFTIVCEQYYL
ncbi:hypothetical protein MTBLM5_120016 [Magnetospirillum sp. LM-5]|nr:hypothetical protein MTBLM5_120016 [Magnetospirillum sp. LM-5]